MHDNIIVRLLNSADSSNSFFYLLVALAVWCLIWVTFLGNWLRKQKVGSFAETLSQFGPLGVFAFALLLCVLVILFIGTIQIIISDGIKAVFAAVVFWGIIVSVVVFAAKHK